MFGLLGSNQAQLGQTKLSLAGNSSGGRSPWETRQKSTGKGQIMIGWADDFGPLGYKMEILVNGQPIKEYPHRDGKTYVEGRRGSEFTLRIRNNTWDRILAVASVDGLSVMNGKTASFNSGGYVVSPHSYVDIRGWRLDNREVARFFFDKLEASYAAQMDKPENVGVIGCAIFNEVKAPNYFHDFPYIKRLHSHDHPMKGFGENETFSAKTLGAGPSRGIGTGFGERAIDKVRTVDFDRALLPAATFAIHYAERDDLIRYGINLRPSPEVSYSPNPFPGEQGCTPPPGWRG